MLKNHLGKIVQDDEYRGKLMLVFFGYTFCPDICPTALSTVATSLDILGGDAEQIAPLFISVDPERDTPDKLWYFVQAFHPSIIGLTGSREMIERLTKDYKVVYEKVPAANDSPPDEYLIDHSAGIYLMDRDGNFLVKFIHGVTPDDLAARIRDFL